MNRADVLYLTVIAIGLLVDHFVLWRTFLRRNKTDARRARLRLWTSWLILLWTLAIPGIVLWSFEGRDWEALGLAMPQGWRLWSAIGLAVVLVAFFARTAVRVARSRHRVAVHPDAVDRAPHTGSEFSRWVALSLSAGFCEELVFRGYLIWVFQPTLGLWGAAALSLAIFAVAHAYQGAKGILAVGVMGGLFTLVVLVSGSLLPAIVLHALVDVGQGLVAWLILRRSPDTRVLAAA